MHSLKTHLHNIFSVKDLGRSNYFLGFEVTYLDAGIVLSQIKFTIDLLHTSNIKTFKKVSSPLPLNLKLYSNDSALFHDPTHYKSIIGKLNFFTHTRPYLTFTFQTLSQYMQNPIDLHYKALEHTLNYVATTKGHGILLKDSDNLKLKAYSEFLGVCLDIRHYLRNKVKSLSLLQMQNIVQRL